jgi:hypothetical protein
MKQALTFDWVRAEANPPRPGIYPVQVMQRNPVTQEPLGMVERHARWTGRYWCSWGNTPRRAAMCDWRGPIQGYSWRHPSQADSIAA